MTQESSCPIGNAIDTTDTVTIATAISTSSTTNNGRATESSGNSGDAVTTPKAWRQHFRSYFCLVSACQQGEGVRNPERSAFIDLWGGMLNKKTCVHRWELVCWSVCKSVHVHPLMRWWRGHTEQIVYPWAFAIASPYCLALAYCQSQTEISVHATGISMSAREPVSNPHSRPKHLDWDGFRDNLSAVGSLDQGSASECKCAQVHPFVAVTTPTMGHTIKYIHTYVGIRAIEQQNHVANDVAPNHLHRTHRNTYKHSRQTHRIGRCARIASKAYIYGCA